jgi:hypothetical protein
MLSLSKHLYRFVAMPLITTLARFLTLFGMTISL